MSLAQPSLIVLAANGGDLPDGILETARSQLAATLRRDADGLIAITATH